MTDELNTGILLTKDCFLCDEFSILTSGTRYCKYYTQTIASELLPLWKYQNITELHCGHYQREKENEAHK